MPALLDNDARVAAEPDDAYAVLTKPHGHGDVHLLLHTSGRVVLPICTTLCWESCPSRRRFCCGCFFTPPFAAAHGSIVSVHARSSGQGVRRSETKNAKLLNTSARMASSSARVAVAAQARRALGGRGARVGRLLPGHEWARVPPGAACCHVMRTQYVSSRVSHQM